MIQEPIIRKRRAPKVHERLRPWFPFNEFFLRSLSFFFFHLLDIENFPFSFWELIFVFSRWSFILRKSNLEINSLIIFSGELSIGDFPLWFWDLSFSFLRVLWRYLHFLILSLGTVYLEGINFLSFLVFYISGTNRRL